MKGKVYYMHIPLWVQGFYMDVDLPVPKRVIFDRKEYRVKRVISSGERPAKDAELPLRKYLVEFTCGAKKTLYYDVKHKEWYSVKKITEEKAREIRHARGEGFPKEYFRSVIDTNRYLSVRGEK